MKKMKDFALISSKRNLETVYFGVWLDADDGVQYTEDYLKVEGVINEVARFYNDIDCLRDRRSSTKGPERRVVYDSHGILFGS
jgi:hypothetical protein